MSHLFKQVWLRKSHKVSQDLAPNEMCDFCLSALHKAFRLLVEFWTNNENTVILAALRSILFITKRTTDSDTGNWLENSCLKIDFSEEFLKNVIT